MLSSLIFLVFARITLMYKCQIFVQCCSESSCDFIEQLKLRRFCLRCAYAFKFNFPCFCLDYTDVQMSNFCSLSVAVKAAVILLNNLNCVDFASTCKQPLEEISLANIIK